MIVRGEARHAMRLDDYALHGTLSAALADLRAEARRLVPRLGGATVWMVNSTAEGGGVAELLPGVVTLLGDLGVRCEWLVIRPGHPDFFALTKRIHNLVHGEAEEPLRREDGALYAAVSRACADALRAHVRPGDIVVVHDPQPLGAGALLRAEMEIRAVWRCHIGLDGENAATRMAWEFLRPYAEAYDRAVFSIPDYIPWFLAGRSSVIHPGIDPLSHKNRGLSLHKHVGILCAAGLTRPHWHMLTPPFEPRARRLQPEGTWGEATDPDDIGLLHGPVLTQVSRWDRLKDPCGVLAGFARLDDARSHGAHLVLAGPSAVGVTDDPEGASVLLEVVAAWGRLPDDVRRRVHIVSLPTIDVDENAAMVNALQRHAAVIVQKSLQEGFGLTVTEAMWKARPVIASGVGGIRDQIDHGVHGLLLADPRDLDAFASALERVLADPAEARRMAEQGRARVLERYLGLGSLLRYGALIEWLDGAGAHASLAGASAY